MTGLALVMVLFAQTPAATRTIKVQVLLGEKPAPTKTEVRLFNPARGLCGTAQYAGAPMRNPDAQGWVTFEGVEAGASLRAEHQAYGSAATGLEGAGPFTLRFPAGLPLRGRVVDGNGRAALRARVAVISSEGDHTLRLQAVNEKDGTFFFGNLSKGKWAVLADSFDDQWSQAVEVSAGNEKVEAKLTALASISGQVLDTNGTPVAEPRLEVRTVGTTDRPFWQLGPPKSQTEYDALLKPPADPAVFHRWFWGEADGRFDTSLATARRVEVKADSRQLCTSSPWTPVTPGKALELRVPAPSKLELKLVGASGAPVPKVTMSLESRQSSADCELTDAELEPVDGLISREVPAAVRSVTVRAVGHQPWTKAVTLKSGKELNLGTVKLSLGSRLVGKVIGVDGKPAAHEPVYLGEEYVANADENGNFVADGLKPGKATVYAGSDGAAQSARKKLNLTAGGESAVELQLAVMGK